MQSEAPCPKVQFVPSSTTNSFTSSGPETKPIGLPKDMLLLGDPQMPLQP